VIRIALIGSLATGTADPKDADVLVMGERLHELRRGAGAAAC
jgi:predicted nucleotidyltransferase